MLEYFANSWQPNYDRYEYSGWALLSQVADHELILDIGCGYNLFKPYWKDRLWGIDPANSCADECVALEHFVTDQQWDVVLCLGSLNFGTRDRVKAQVARAVELTKPGGRIYWRQNPGLSDHPWPGVETVQFFKWSVPLNYEWAAEFGCTVRECEWDAGNRIYAQWQKN